MNGTCKISDFGISKRTDELHGGAFTALQGTVFWMAPEVINTQGKGYNFKIDIWSVGCVVLEMWGGRRPWTGQEMVAVMFKVWVSRAHQAACADCHLSSMKPSCPLQSQMTLFFLSWRMISGRNALQCTSHHHFESVVSDVHPQ